MVTNRREALNVQLEQFEGPLALLLFLIRKEEMDIYNIQIHEITKRYLEYIQTMKKLDLEVASEFITMAATLIHIKSRVLLPQYDEAGEEVQDDPRKELVQRLVEYQKFQNLSKRLNQRPILGRDLWRKGIKEDIVLEENQEVELEDSGLFGLISAYRNIVKSAQKRIHRVMQKGQSIASRILEIREFLIPGQRTIMMTLIRPGELTKNKLLVTFLSMLELGKMGFVRVFQSEPYSDIYVETMKPIDGDVVSRVESYDGANAEIAAQILIEKSRAQVSDAQILQSEFGQTGFTFEQNYELKDNLNTEEIVESATDADIQAAERELELAAMESESITPSMEPLDDIGCELNASAANVSITTESIETDVKRDYEPEL